MSSSASMELPQPTQCPQCAAPVIGEHPSFCSHCRLPLFYLAGKYQLQSEIGAGGGGVVYLARHLHLSLNPLRVIKLLHPHFLQSPTALRRFAKEIEVTSVLSQNNEHIVRIYDDFGEIPGLGYFYVMEYLQGQTLHQTIARHPGGLPVTLALQIFDQLCIALKHIHKAGVIHRDLKPQNVFLVEREDAPHFVKVMDFGIVRHTDHPTLSAGQGGMVGTPLYMSPEQCANQPVDARSDLYALGMILFEMLSGKLPFPMDSQETPLLELTSLRMFSKPLPLRDVMGGRAASLPSGLQEAVMRSLEKEPHARFQDVDAFRAAVWSTRMQETSPAEGLSLPSSSFAGLPPAPASPLPSSHPANQTRSRKIWLLLPALALCGLLLFLAQLWKASPRPTSPVPDAREAPQAPPRPLAAKRQEPPGEPVDAGARQKRPERRRLLPRRAKQSPRKRRRRVRHRSRPRRARPSTPGCPPDGSRGRWIFVALVPADARVTTGHQMMQTQRGFCIFQAPKGAALQIRLTHPGYQPCSFSRAFRRRSQTIRLKRSQRLGFDERLDYCAP